MEDKFPADGVQIRIGEEERPTIAELYPGRFGRIEGSSEPYSEDTGRRFTE